MNRPFTWDDIFEMWNSAGYHLGEELDMPPEVKIVPIEWDKEDYEFYGYDWIDNKVAEERIELIHRDLDIFFYSKPTSTKGTMHTANILNQVENAEDRAAIWIAATTCGLDGFSSSTDAVCGEFFDAAVSHLCKRRIPLWHHAMKRRVPKIHTIGLLPEYEEELDVPQKVMNCIAINTMLLRQTHKMLLYSSRKEHRNKKFEIVKRGLVHETLG